MRFLSLKTWEALGGAPSANIVPGVLGASFLWGDGTSFQSNEANLTLCPHRHAQHRQRIVGRKFVDRSCDLTSQNVTSLQLFAYCWTTSGKLSWKLSSWLVTVLIATLWSKTCGDVHAQP